jgi:hypothetical protein
LTKVLPGGWGAEMADRVRASWMSGARERVRRNEATGKSVGDILLSMKIAVLIHDSRFKPLLFQHYTNKCDPNTCFHAGV